MRVVRSFFFVKTGLPDTCLQVHLPASTTLASTTNADASAASLAPSRPSYASPPPSSPGGAHAHSQRDHRGRVGSVRGVSRFLWPDGVGPVDLVRDAVAVHTRVRGRHRRVGTRMCHVRAMKGGGSWIWWMREPDSSLSCNQSIGHRTFRFFTTHADDTKPILETSRLSGTFTFGRVLVV